MSFLLIEHLYTTSCLLVPLPSTLCAGTGKKRGRPPKNHAVAQAPPPEVLQPGSKRSRKPTEPGHFQHVASGGSPSQLPPRATADESEEYRPSSDDEAAEGCASEVRCYVRVRIKANMPAHCRLYFFGCALPQRLCIVALQSLQTLLKYSPCMQKYQLKAQAEEALQRQPQDVNELRRLKAQIDALPRKFKGSSRLLLALHNAVFGPLRDR